MLLIIKFLSTFELLVQRFNNIGFPHDLTSRTEFVSSDKLMYFTLYTLPSL